MAEAKIALESRIVRNEVNVASIQDDIKEIKRNIRWIIGIVFSLNGTIVGLLAKALSLM
jgi:hypothetical protein